MGYDIYTDAVSRVSGLGRTVRGPSMSSTPGKVHVLGSADIKGEKVFMLKFLQARNPAWMGQVFFAKYDPEAVWLDGLTPAFGEDKFFFEDELADMERIALECGGSSGQVDYATASKGTSGEIDLSVFSKTLSSSMMGGQVDYATASKVANGQIDLSVFSKTSSSSMMANP